MKEKYPLVLKILKEFNNQGLLNELVLVGSWCLYFYKHHFKELKTISLVRTLDIDFLVPSGKKIKQEIDVPLLLKQYDFEEMLNLQSGWAKYAHPDLELEFLTPKLGRGLKDVISIKELHVNAMTLRYLDLLQRNIIHIQYKGITLSLPDPIAFSFHKFIVSQRRQQTLKQEKDLQSAIEIAELLIENDSQKERILEIFESFSQSWQKTIKKITKDTCPKLHDILINK